MRLLEPLLFTGLAAALHVAALGLGLGAGGGGAPAGDGGDAAVTLQAAPDGLAALAERWEAAPALPTAQAPAPPAPAAPAAPRAPAMQTSVPRRGAACARARHRPGAGAQRACGLPPPAGKGHSRRQTRNGAKAAQRRRAAPPGANRKGHRHAKRQRTGAASRRRPLPGRHRLRQGAMGRPDPQRRRARPVAHPAAASHRPGPPAHRAHPTGPARRAAPPALLRQCRDRPRRARRRATRQLPARTAPTDRRTLQL